MTSGLLVIDVQNGVVDGMPGRDELIATIGRLVESARAAQRPVVWVQHADEDIPHGSEAWQVVPELRPEEGEPVVEKQHRSAFGDTGLGALLREYDVERLVIVWSPERVLRRHGGQARPRRGLRRHLGQRRSRQRRSGDH